MTWHATITGPYQSVVQQLKDLEPATDELAVAYGHVQIAKDSALVVVDSKKQLDAVFSISLGGHTSTKDSFAVSTNVTVVQQKPEEG